MHKFLTKKNLYYPRNQLDLKQWFSKKKRTQSCPRMREKDLNNKQHNKNNTREMDFPLLPACLPQYGDDILAWKHLGAHPRNICQTL
jgi:hypothetical protein